MGKVVMSPSTTKSQEHEWEVSRVHLYHHKQALTDQRWL